MTSDLIIRNANLPDGRTRVSILARKGRIAEIGTVPAIKGAREIDAKGYLVSPPFVDAHFHMDATLSLGQPRMNVTGTLLEGIALWGELKPAGVDVLGLILGETDTPALRRLKVERRRHASVDAPVRGAASVEEVVEDALAHLAKGPTRLANKPMRWGLKLFFPVPRRTIVRLMTLASNRTMGMG